MVHQTEAACLLETGALYRNRVLLQPEAGDPIFAGFKAGGFSLYFGDAPIFHFDRDGRWQRAYDLGLHYLKGLDTAVRTIDRVREGENLVLKRRTLDPAEAADFDAVVRAAALNLLDDLRSGRLGRVEPPSRAEPLSPDDLTAMLDRIARWDAPAWAEHRELYRATYGPLPFLPPDCPNSVILQATLGHPDGVAFGAGVAFGHHARTPEEFAAHANAVARLYGRRIGQCRSIFLAGGDALARPSNDVVAYLEAAADHFAIDPEAGRARPAPGLEVASTLDGIHAFLDDFAGGRHHPAAWRRFRQLHLTRLSLGVESGDPEIRAELGKTWGHDDLAAVVADAKAAGIGLGVLTLIGAGGLERAGRQLNATVDLLKSLPLGAGDIVYLLDVDQVRDSAHPAAYPTLAPSNKVNERAAFQRKLGPLRDPGVKVAPYNFEKQGLS